MADIDKILNVKPKIKPKTIVPEQYWGYLNVFDEDETNQLPPTRGKKIDHEIELLEEEGKCYDLSLTGRFAGNVCQNLSLAVYVNVGNVQTH